MIYYKICYYNRNCLLGGQYLKENQLKFVKTYVDPYLQLYKKINVRIESAYYPNSIRENLEVQSIEVL